MLRAHHTLGCLGAIHDLGRVVADGSATAVPRYVGEGEGGASMPQHLVRARARHRSPAGLPWVEAAAPQRLMTR